VIDYSRWRGFPLPEVVDLAVAASRAEVRPDLYDYEPVPGVEGGLEWHVNFADPHLFVAYAGSLFAQDEMQVAEHPILGSLKECLEAKGMKTLTVENGHPTPVLVAGAQRCCRVKTDVNPEEGRPAGLYGNAFRAADEEAIRRATVPIVPPTVTNLVAIAAPAGESGEYSGEQVRGILVTAFSGFSAARLETDRLKGPGYPLVIHTGFWGCGAFGGNRELMALLQVAAAGMAGADGLVFHAHTQAGVKVFEQAIGRLGKLGDKGPVPVEGLVSSVLRAGYAWGVSDGN
jgi:hypothetical protein